MSVRESTEGMVNALGKPAWIVDYRDEHGRRRQVKTDATSMKEARLIEASILTQIEKAKALGLSRQALTPKTFAQFTDETYLPAMKAKVRGSTYKSYVRLCGKLKDYFGTMSLASITPNTIDDYFRSTAKEITAQKRAPGAGELNNRRARLMAIMGMAEMKEWIPRNPVKAVERQEYDPEEKHLITADEEEQLLNASPDWLRPFIVMGLYGGLREGEIAKMKWEHVQSGFIHVPEENAKNGEERDVPINARLEAVLADLARVRMQEGSPDWVFYSRARKGHFLPNSVSMAFTRLAEGLGIPATFHCTRHSFITRMQDSGIALPHLKAITGQKTDAMVAHYTHLKRAHLKGKTDVLCRESARQTQDAVAQR